jgi:hypothetical protein
MLVEAGQLLIFLCKRPIGEILRGIHIIVNTSQSIVHLSFKFFCGNNDTLVVRKGIIKGAEDYVCNGDGNCIN